MKVLILEDEPLIAMSMEAMVEDLGGTVVGPFGRIADAMAAIADGSEVSSALLDCNLGGAPAWPVAEALAARNIPFAFTSGQLAKDIDPRFANRPTFTKPIDEAKVKRFLTNPSAA